MKWNERLGESLRQSALAMQAKADTLQTKADELNAPFIQQVSCPRCHSTDFSVTRKHINRAGFLLGGPLFGISNKTEAVCHKCGKHFKV